MVYEESLLAGQLVSQTASQLSSPLTMWLIAEMLFGTNEVYRKGVLVGKNIVGVRQSQPAY